MVKASIKIRKRPLQNDQKLLLKNNENKAPPEKWYRYIQTTYPEKWDELIQTITNTSTGSDLKEHCKRNVNGELIVNIYQNKIIFQKKTSSVLFYMLVYKISLPLSCNHWMLCITLLWHGLKPYCSIHVTFHSFFLIRISSMATIISLST